MKRIGYLADKIAEMDNLYLAYYKAQKGKGHKTEINAFRKELKANLLLLQAEIIKGEFVLGIYHYFTIYDPKERIICAASFKERVLHHAIMNVCHIYFEQYQIYDSYACRKEKGNYKALERAKFFSATHLYFAKLDVRKFFETIDHFLLKKSLIHRFKDKKLLRFFFQIIDSYHTETNKGIPIGNLTSQYFANHFLAQADHFIKETLQIKAYIRYMDDMVIWETDKEKLTEKVAQLLVYMKNTLQCEMKTVVMNSIEKGLPFLGYVVWKDKMTLAKRSRIRFKQKLIRLDSLFANIKITEFEYQKKILPLLAFVQKSSCFLFRKRILLQSENKQKAIRSGKAKKGSK